MEKPEFKPYLLIISNDTVYKYVWKRRLKILQMLGHLPRETVHVPLKDENGALRRTSQTKLSNNVR